jgi:hypothetical protein
MRFVQLRTPEGDRRLAATGQDGGWRAVANAVSLYDLAMLAIEAGGSLADTAQLADPVDVAAALAEGRVLAPIDHRDPAHLLMTGTGLTHLGSAKSRDEMHAKAAAGAPLTDSMRMFMLGLEGGKPAEGQEGAQPEWFYKGDGGYLVPPGGDLTSPAFAGDGGDEAEIAAIYVVAPDGTPCRLGYCLANEFSDHVTERVNYLWLAHSKLRPASLGPELLATSLPPEVVGTSRIRRDGAVVWERPMLSGEANMAHSLANLEAHHFKYDLFRRPGDVHVHFLGAAVLSCADGFVAQPNDEFEITAPPFEFPLRNRLVAAPAQDVRVRQL